MTIRMKSKNPKRLIALALLSIVAALPVAAGIIPVDLPPPDAKPLAKDKPVKIYIQSGQSNSLGFGAVKAAGP